MVGSGGGVSPGPARETADPQSWRGGSERGNTAISKPIASIMLTKRVPGSRDDGPGT